MLQKKNDITVGTILAGNDGRRGYIYHTAISENYRKIGVASMLVDKVMQAFEDIGISKASLVVFKDNKQGNAFWQKQGFNERTDLIHRKENKMKLVIITGAGAAGKMTVGTDWKALRAKYRLKII